MSKADLHLHSVQSDGSCTREEILSRAVQLGLTHLSFTEHDDTHFASQAVSLGRQFGIRVLPGLRSPPLTRRWANAPIFWGISIAPPRRLHRSAPPVLRRRHENCLWQIEQLRRLGYRITAQDVLPYAAGGTLYKQHIYHYLLDSGQSEALFGRVKQKFFSHGGPCDRRIEYPDPREAVAAIRADGGFAVLAHPGQQQNFALLPDLVDAGLSGIELCHLSNSPSDRLQIRALAKQYGLFCTGGSDFHGIYEEGRDQLGVCLAPEDCPLLALADTPGR